jgi:hypothetical protein
MNKKGQFIISHTLALVLPIVMMMVLAITGVGSIAAIQRPEGPCDIYAAAGTPCVAAHSSTRALYASYHGPLYQVKRQSDGKTLDIGIIEPKEGDPGGYADAAAQDTFCTNTLCWITMLYDQSGKGNHLYQAPPGTFKGPDKGAFNTLPISDMAPITISGHKAYGVYIMPGMGLRNNDATGIAINDEPEGIYYVINGKHYDSGCCFDYGNSSTNGRAVGTGTMETTYYGTATAWGSGNGSGPWIMADMEAGLFSGYNAKKNDVPTIDSWQFVTVVVDGGGGNKWDLRGGNAQKGNLTTFYSGIRPGTPNSKDYFPMNKKGGILMGNGGDNGNGSAGTFYEGVMTTGFPTEATTDAVQANIVAAKYDVQMLSLSRTTTFTPGSLQEVTETFTNTTGASVTNVRLSISAPKEWIVAVSGSSETSKTFANSVEPGISVSATFKITSPSKASMGFLIGKADWKNQTAGGTISETITHRIRNTFPVKINEVRFSTSANPTNQFVELYNASGSSVDIANWTLINTPSQWASVKAATIPAKTKLSAKGFYLLGLSSSGLTAPVTIGATIINVRSTTGFEVGQKINIDGETRTITSIGTASSALTTLFIPVSTGPWLSFPAGTNNLPVTNATGFEVGQKIGIDIGGIFEIATVTSVGKAATQTTLAAPAVAGSSNIKVSANTNMSVGDMLTIGTGNLKELVKVTNIGSTGADGTGIDLASPLKFNNMLGVDVSDLGTGITFTPSTKYPHKSGDAIQALGSGITLDSPLSKNHEYGAAVINLLATTVGYQGSVVPNQWYGGPLSASAGSIALMDASGEVLVDGLVYGSQQSSSSANGTIASPEIATLEGDQSQGGCIVVAPRPSGGDGVSSGRFPDGFDTDNNCIDFLLQSAYSLSAASSIGATNIKVSSVVDLTIGQELIIDAGANRETSIIAAVGTAGASTVGKATSIGSLVIPVPNAAGFAIGQAIIIDKEANLENAVVSSIIFARRRFGMQNNNLSDSIKLTVPLSKAHDAEVQVSGSGITLSAPLAKAHDKGIQVASFLPTPGAPNRYFKN